MPLLPIHTFESNQPKSKSFNKPKKDPLLKLKKQNAKNRRRLPGPRIPGQGITAKGVVPQRGAVYGN